MRWCRKVLLPNASPARSPLQVVLPPFLLLHRVMVRHGLKLPPIARAHAKIQQGDIAAARQLLERALGSDDGDAWFVLAETYDPQMLAGWRVIGIKPDLEKAKT